MFEPALNFTLLFVENPQKSAQFYQQIFGLKPIETSPTFAMFALKNGVMLGLWSKYTAEPQVTAPSGAQEICFPTDNIDKAYEDLTALQVTVRQKPTNMDFGNTFVFEDPDGHRIRIMESRK